MIKIERVGRPVKTEKRYGVVEIAKALGYSEGAISGFFTNRSISTKNGLDLSQIVDAINGRRRGPGVNWNDVAEIRRRLDEEYGIIITEESESADETEAQNGYRETLLLD